MPTPAILSPAFARRKFNRSGDPFAFTKAKALLVIEDINHQHCVHTCDLPTPMSDHDVRFFTDVLPIISQFRDRIWPMVRGIRLVSCVVEVTLVNGDESHHAIHPLAFK